MEIFGSRARVGTLHDLTPSATNSAVAHRSSNPLIFRLEANLSVGWSKRDEERDLSRFLEMMHQRAHDPITTLERPEHVTQETWNGYLVQKAATLLNAGRALSNVVDMTIAASGSVDGHPIADRTLFAQCYKPQGTPNGMTVVVAPGFLETGRNYAEQALAMSAKGYEVLVFDQQWAGMSSGPKGGIDRGFGIARDVAAVAAKAAENGNKVILLGTSMGGGPGAYGAIHLNEQGRIQLVGPQMPKGVPAILQAPYFATKRSFINNALSAMGMVPGLRNLELPATGLPILSSDPLTLHKFASHTTIEDVTGRTQAFNASTADLQSLRAELPAHAPRNAIYVIQGRHDTVADYGATADVVGQLGTSAHLKTLETANHVFEETPGQQDEIFLGLDWLAQRHA